MINSFGSHLVIWQSGMRLVVTLVLVTILGACDFFGSCTPPPLASDAFEPNDTPQQATPISGELLATLNEEDLPDFYSFEATAQEYVKFRLERTGGGFLVADLETLDAAGQVLVNPPEKGYGNTPFDRTNVTYVLQLPKAGKYTLKVSGRYTGPRDSFCSKGRLSYRLRLERPAALEAPALSLKERTADTVTLILKPVEGASDYQLEDNKAGLWHEPSIRSRTKAEGNILYEIFVGAWTGGIKYRVRASFGGLLGPPTELTVNPLSLKP